MLKSRLINRSRWLNPGSINDDKKDERYSPQMNANKSKYFVGSALAEQMCQPDDVLANIRPKKCSTEVEPTKKYLRVFAFICGLYLFKMCPTYPIDPNQNSVLFSRNSWYGM